MDEQLRENASIDIVHVVPLLSCTIILHSDTGMHNESVFPVQWNGDYGRGNRPRRHQES